jgi:putative lipoic acid-binding regulatory protein
MRSLAAALTLCAPRHVVHQIRLQHRPRFNFSTLQSTVTALDNEQLETAASAALQDWFETHGRIAVLTGAGISTDSGM